VSWSPYPSEPSQRRSTIVRDVLAFLALLLLAWLGRRVYQLVDNLSILTDSVQNVGTAVQNGFGAAADAVAGTPIIGDEVAGALQAAGSASGGNVVDLALTGDTAELEQRAKARQDADQPAIDWLMVIFWTIIILWFVYSMYRASQPGAVGRSRGGPIIMPGPGWDGGSSGGGWSSGDGGGGGGFSGGGGDFGGGGSSGSW